MKRAVRVACASSLGLLVTFGGGAAWSGTQGSAVAASATPLPRCDAIAPNFGGYSERKAGVDEISASWVVPRISPSARTGDASTWIAIEGRTGSFLQLGTEERVVTGPGPTFARPKYRGFWSDTALDFHGQPVLDVAGGDHVEASMRRVDQGWRLRLTDVTRGTAAALTVPYGGKRHFTQGDWLQEDSSSGTGCNALAYPDMTGVSLHDLRIDNVVPDLSYARATVLEAPNGVILVPSRFRGDGFSVSRPTGVAMQYLRDTAPINLAWVAFVWDLRQWRRSPASLRASEKPLAVLGADHLVSSVKFGCHELSSERWSDRTEPDIRALVRGCAQLATSAEKWTKQFGRSSNWTLRYVRRAFGRTSVAAAKVRASLGLPRA